MNPERLCARCLAPLPANSVQGLCSSCQNEPEDGSTASQSPTVKMQAEDTQTVTFTEPPLTSAGPRPGARFGAYQIIRLLGEGGMGMVFEAEQVESGRRVALKILNHALDLPDTRKRFLREGRLAAGLSHPNLVYIFGTEEIEGSSVIAMELVSGGTLKDRIKKDGPLPVNEAVDVCLQIIAGLEVAAGAGVLHRDIKPSNCFIDSDGVVKVGDFGLSISTLARAETQLTLTGTFLGTPAFSSPEQLRGDELDVRSDIYAVGVTLYDLLTGRTPFEGDNLVKLLATVLEEVPQSPTKLRRDIPRGLSKAVLRCLAKKPGQRFKDYAELRAALQPFATMSLKPASLNLRGGAGFLDWLITLGAFLGVTLLFRACGLPTFTDPDSLVGTGIYCALCLSYFSVFESVWAATPGKALNKLRLVRLDRGRVRFVDALVRAIWYVILPQIPAFLVEILLLSHIGRAHEFAMSVYGSIGGLLLLGLLFISVRKRNGCAALHDLWSRTRVINLSLSLPRLERVGMQRPNEVVSESEFPFRIGPYHAAHSLDQVAEFELFAGYDKQLLRKVWLRKLPAGAPPVPSERQKLSRPTRLRLIGGRRSPEENWDAFEAVSGKPLLSGEAKPGSWSQVRFWLLDLAQEIEAGCRTQTMVPALNLDLVWIGADGRVRLLDAPPPHNPTVGETGPPPCAASAPGSGSDFPSFVDLQTRQLFLKQVALAALEGPADQRDAEGLRPPAVPLPLHARHFLQKLPRFPNGDALIQELKELLSRPAVVTRATRVRGLLFLVVPCLFCGPFLVLTSLVCSAVFRGSYWTHRMDVAYVGRDGSTVSRARLCWRNFLALLPVLTIFPVVSQYKAHPKVTMAGIIGLAVLFAIGMIRCIRVPERSFADCLAGTWMVPR